MVEKLPTIKEILHSESSITVKGLEQGSDRAPPWRGRTTDKRGPNWPKIQSNLRISVELKRSINEGVGRRFDSGSRLQKKSENNPRFSL